MRHKGTGGTERYLNQVAAALALRGHAVTIVCRTHEAAPHPAVRFEVLRRPSFGAAARMWAFAREVEARHLERDFELVYGLGRTWGQDVVRLGGGLVATHLEHARRSAQTAGERLELALALKWRLAQRIERRALAPGAGAARLVIANSELVRRDVLARYARPPGEVVTVHNGADCERFHPRLRASAGAKLRAAWGVGAADHLVLFLASGYRRKGLRDLLEAFARLAPSDPRLRLAVVGYDSRLQAYAERARRLGILERAHFAGGRRDPEACFAAADVYVLPTYYDPFANSTVEALAAGLPVVTTATNGGAELIEDGVEGAVVAAGDVAALAGALARFRDPAVCRAAGQRARARALATDEQVVMQRTLALLEGAAHSAAGSGSNGGAL